MALEVGVVMNVGTLSAVQAGSQEVFSMLRVVLHIHIHSLFWFSGYITGVLSSLSFCKAICPFCKVPVFLDPVSMV